MKAFLAECADLAAFVEGNRLGGPARTWFEASYPERRWHVAVGDGYVSELADYLARYASAIGDDRNKVLAQMRLRAVSMSRHLRKAHGAVSWVSIALMFGGLCTRHPRHETR